MFKIKICGITSPADALLAAKLGADAIGLNFYEKSPRYITPLSAADISAQLPSHVERVGVFVNAGLAQIQNTVEVARLTCVQLHGDETEEFLGQLDSIVPLTIKAFRLPDPGNDTGILLMPVAEYLGAIDLVVGCRQPLVLLDAHRAHQFGGTGATLDWHTIHKERFLTNRTPLILAGGLTPENVAEAILTARPDAIDVASGVESSHGQKDPHKLRDFIASAQEAFTKLARRASEG
jgi:phosphoribosylanthranilate isomerase